MNIEKVYKAMESDSMNSALYIVVSELENQGYRVQVNNIYVNSKNINDGKYKGLEDQSELNLSLLKSDVCIHNLIIKFTDYHRIEIIYVK